RLLGIQRAEEKRHGNVECVRVTIRLVLEPDARGYRVPGLWQLQREDEHVALLRFARRNNDSGDIPEYLQLILLRRSSEGPSIEEAIRPGHLHGHHSYASGWRCSDEFRRHQTRRMLAAVVEYGLGEGQVLANTSAGRDVPDALRSPEWSCVPTRMYDSEE